MTIQKRSQDATRRVMDVIRHLDETLTKEQLLIIEDDWYDYFHALLSDEIEDSELTEFDLDQD